MTYEIVKKTEDSQGRLHLVVRDRETGTEVGYVRINQPGHRKKLIDKLVAAIESTKGDAG